MIWTRANAEEHALSKGLEPVQIDGIPEGFSFKEPDLQIGEEIHVGKYVLFQPLGVDAVRTETQEELLTSYNTFKNGK